MLSISKRQLYLNKLNLYDGKIDGIEGNKTRKAYLKLQKLHFSRKVDIDGLYGPNTDILLLNAIRTHNRTPDFALSEFKCECGGKYCTGYPAKLSTDLLDNLQTLRNHYGKPIVITSGIRCKQFNASLAGSSSVSRHMQGKAVDLYITGGKSNSISGRKDIIKTWMKYPKSNYAYQGTANMGNATHVDVI